MLLGRQPIAAATFISGRGQLYSRAEETGVASHVEKPLPKSNSPRISRFSLCLVDQNGHASVDRSD